MIYVRKPDDPHIICEDCGATGSASRMIQLSSAWLCRSCWHIDSTKNRNTDTQEDGK